MAWVGVLLCLVAAAAEHEKRSSGPWNIDTLTRPPKSVWTFDEAANVYKVYYDGVPYRGHETRVFGYCAIPSAGTPPFPALVLVHGATQHAYADWAVHWAERGYLALAIDLTGEDAAGAMADGGPPYYTGALFEPFDDQTLTDTWIFHAVSATVRGVSLLWNRPDVDPARIGVHGISMGGVITSTVAGIDERISLAVPVYGTGYLFDDNTILTAPLLEQTCEQRQRWCRTFDPSLYLPQVTAPMLFVGGATDAFFSPPSVLRSLKTIPAPVTVSLRSTMDHGSVWRMPWYEQEILRFIDARFLGSPALPRIEASMRNGDEVSSRYTSQVPIQQADLLYTMDLGPWKDRKWQSLPAVLGPASVTANLPAARPLAYYLALTEQGGVFVSAPIVLADSELGSQLRINEISYHPQKGLQLLCAKPSAHGVALQVSRSFSACGWTTISTNSDPGESFLITQPGAFGSSQTFYRLVDLDW